MYRSSTNGTTKVTDCMLAAHVSMLGLHACTRMYGVHDTADTSSCHPHNGLKKFGENLNKQELRCGINVVTILCV